LNPSEEMNHLPLIGSYVDGRKAGCDVGFQCLFQNNVAWNEKFDEIAIDMCPEFFGHTTG
jgi:hypothetical protein